jgi:hypothetical protein
MTEDSRPIPLRAVKGAPRGSASFCIPRAALDALVREQASALEVGAYLTLARFTDATGVYTPASVKAVNGRTGTGKALVEKALERLATIRAKKIVRVHNGRSGKSGGWVEQTEDLGPILMGREAWIAAYPDRPLPDGPTERGMVRYVLPDFAEPAEDRVWIGAGLVDGIGTFDRPLWSLKNAGPVAARLLLQLYVLNNMERWGGIDPLRGPWIRYEPEANEPAGVNLPGGARLLRATRVAKITPHVLNVSVSGDDTDAYWRALEALEAIGLIYEMVTVLNRNAKPSKFANGQQYGDIPDDAEPLYELDCRSRHGFKPAGEEGLAGLTARTAGDFQRPVTDGGFTWDGYEQTGTFIGTYAAIVPAGSGVMIAGIYRMRFRVANPKNAGVRDAWSRIRQGNRDMYEFINAVRAFNKLPLLLPPWEAAARAATAAPKVPPADDGVDWLTGRPRSAVKDNDPPIPF